MEICYEERYVHSSLLVI